MVDAELLLIRHGQSQWNAVGRWQGHGDPPLSPLGRQQARALARSLGSPAVARFVVSDLRRARQTARALEESWGIEAEPRPALRELDVGDWTGLTRSEILARDPELLAEFESGAPDVRPGGGESRGEIRARVRAEVEVLVAGLPPRSGALVIVTHLGVIRALWPGTDAEHARAYRARWSELRRLHASAPETEPDTASR